MLSSMPWAIPFGESEVMKEVSSMSENKKVYYIPEKPSKRDKRVGIYCRVSASNQAEYFFVHNKST